MKDLADINKHSDNDRLFRRNRKELAKRVEGGDKCISQCINQAGDKTCAIAIIPVIMLGHHVYKYVGVNCPRYSPIAYLTFMKYNS